MMPPTFEWRCIVTRATKERTGFMAMYVVGVDGQWSLAFSTGYANEGEYISSLDCMREIEADGLRRMREQAITRR